MNFKFTPRNTLIFILGLIGAAVIGTWANNSLVGLPILIATIYYIAHDKPKK